MNIEILPELENLIKLEINSYYRYINVSQLGNLPGINTSKNLILIELPSDICFNPSMLSISFILNQVGTTADKFNAIPTNYIPFFSRCELYSSSNNIRLLDVQNLDYYSKMNLALFDNFNNGSQNSYLFNSVRTTLITSGALGTFTSDAFIDSGVLSDRLVSYNNYLGNSTAANVIPQRVINIKLCDLIPNSFFSINKNIYISNVLYLRLETNVSNAFSFYFNSATNALSSTLDTAMTFTLSNFILTIPCEANNDLINIARQLLNTKEGLGLVLPEIQNSQYSLSGSGGQKGSIVKVVNNSSSDARLYMVISSLSCTVQKATSYAPLNMSNYANGKYNQVLLYINSNLLCLFDTTINLDLNYINSVFENHSFNSELSYKNLSPFVYLFTSKKIKDNKLDGSLLDGITYPNNGEITLNITYNTISNAGDTVVNPSGNNFNHNIFTVTKRKIYMKDGKFSYVPFG